MDRRGPILKKKSNMISDVSDAIFPVIARPYLFVNVFEADPFHIK